ncbi:hypothetical protein TKK_0012625 [Trichogramma kaykai]
MTRLLHKVARSWPPDETNHRHGILRKFLHVLPPIICIVLYIYNLSGFMTARTVEDVLEVINFVSVFTTATGRNFLLALTKPKIHALVSKTIEMEKTRPADELSSIQCQIMKKWRNIHDKLTKFSIYGVLVGALMYLIPPIFFSKLPFPGYSTEALEESKFYAIYFLQLLFACIFIPPWVSVDFYVCTFLCTLCRELDMFYDAMQSIRDKDRSHLHRVIDRHSRILTYGMEVCDIVSYSFGVVHASYGLFLIFGTIAMTQINWSTHGGLAIRNIITMIVCASSLSLMCFIGDLIQDLSTRLGDCIVLDNFLDRRKDRKYLKLLEIVHARSCCSLKIKYSPNMIVNMQMYSVTLNYILSIYTFALTVMA